LHKGRPLALAKACCALSLTVWVVNDSMGEWENVLSRAITD